MSGFEDRCPIHLDHRGLHVRAAGSAHRMPAHACPLQESNPGLRLRKPVLISSEWIESISWNNRRVAVGLTGDEIKNGPEWD